MSMPGLLPDVKYPAMYKKLLDSLDFFTLDIAVVLPSNCAKPGGTSFFDSLVFMTVGPVVLIGIVLVVACIKKLVLEKGAGILCGNQPLR